MKRDMMKTSEKVKGNIPTQYDLTGEELQELHELIHSGSDGEFDALSIAFKYGFALGARAEKTGKYNLCV